MLKGRKEEVKGTKEGGKRGYKGLEGGRILSRRHREHIFDAR